MNPWNQDPHSSPPTCRAAGNLVCHVGPRKRPKYRLLLVLGGKHSLSRGEANWQTDTNTQTPPEPHSFMVEPPSIRNPKTRGLRDSADPRGCVALHEPHHQLKSPFPSVPPSHFPPIMDCPR